VEIAAKNEEVQAQFEEVEAARLAAEPPIFERMEQIA